MPRQNSGGLRNASPPRLLSNLLRMACNCWRQPWRICERILRGLGIRQNTIVIGSMERIELPSANVAIGRKILGFFFKLAATVVLSSSHQTATVQTFDGMIGIEVGSDRYSSETSNSWTIESCLIRRNPVSIQNEYSATGGFQHYD